MNSDKRPDREPPWSIPYGWRVAYVLTFTIKMIVYTVLVTRQEIERGVHNSAIDIAIAVIDRDANVTPGIGASTLITLEGVSYLVITYNYLYNKFVQPVIDQNKERLEQRYAEGMAEGRAEGRAKGRAKGRAEGRAEGIEQGETQGKSVMHQRWADWNSRRMEAESNGMPFDEPPPTSDNEG